MIIWLDYKLAMVGSSNINSIINLVIVYIMEYLARTEHIYCNTKLINLVIMYRKYIPYQT